MLTCPECKCNLEVSNDSLRGQWVCNKCGGRAASLAILRRKISREALNRLWQVAKSGTYPCKRPCPACSNLMAEIPAVPKLDATSLDLCTTCQIVWFDAGELDTLPVLPPEPSADYGLSPEAKKAIAISKLDKIRRDAQHSGSTTGAPDEWWKWIPAVLGMPVESESNPLSRRPWATWSLVSLISLISILTFFDLDNAVAQYGLIPSKSYRLGGLTFFTSFFLHGGIIHLLSNMYFLLIFGDNVEDCLGWKKFLLLLACATLAGDIAHIIWEPRSFIPCIGASGGISGVITFYVLKFPKVKFSIFIVIYFFFRWVNLPVFVFFMLWVGLQIFGAWQQITGFSNVSALAHLGGVAAGVGFWLWQRGNDEGVTNEAFKN